MKRTLGFALLQAILYIISDGKKRCDWFPDDEYAKPAAQKFHSDQPRFA
jgi:hypothetical protein